MTTSNHVTIVIPVFNGIPFIGDAVRSALSQDYAPLSVVVVDNCSSDDTLEELGRINDQRLEVVQFKEFVPLAANWDRAVRLATGDFVMVMSADNEMLPGAISELVKSLKNAPECSAAIGRVRIEVVPGHKKLSLTPVAELVPGAISNLEDHLLRWGYNFSINAVLFRRESQGLYFDPATEQACDVDLLIRLGRSGARAISVNHVVHKWIDHPDTTSSKKYHLVWESIMTTYVKASRSGDRRRDYQNRIGRMLTWECMLLLRRGETQQAREIVERFAATTTPWWRFVVFTMVTIPASHRVPGAIRWLRSRWL